MLVTNVRVIANVCVNLRVRANVNVCTNVSAAANIRKGDMINETKNKEKCNKKSDKAGIFNVVGNGYGN